MADKPKLFASFTGTLRLMKSGEVTCDDLAQGYFMFGCSREHAIAPWDHTTNEVGWFWRDNPEEGRRVHAILVNAMLEAEMEGRTIWRHCSNVDYRIFTQRFAEKISEVVR